MMEEPAIPQLSDAMFREVMLALGSVVDGTLNNSKDRRTIGFVLLAIDMQQPDKNANYISNMKRQAVLHMLKQQVAIFEKGEPE